jgi:hypothetical protein
MVSSIAEARVPEVKGLSIPLAGLASASPPHESSPTSTESTASRKYESHRKGFKEPATTHSHYDPLTSDLSINAMRQPSPQLEHIVSSTSPKHIASAASLLLLFQARSMRLNGQTDALQAESKRIEAVVRQDQQRDVDKKADLKVKLNTLEDMHLLASRHWYELFELECSLRDVIDEDESGTLMKYVEKVSGEFVGMVQAYDAMIREIMVRDCPEVVRETVDAIANGKNASPGSRGDR